jgi:hypothetical protein
MSGGRRAGAALALGLAGWALGVTAAGETIRLSPGDPLAGALRRAGAHPGTVIELAPGDHVLSPTPYTDPTCGNCEDPAEPVPATLGARVSGEGVVIRGPGSVGAPDSSRGEARIVTRAGYGLLFEDCRDCRIEGVTVTGGGRDTCGRATDAAIVVRRSTLAIERCRIAENIGDSATVAKTIVGVMGICGREGSDFVVRDCEIRRNSWDGIALYRDARARISECVIDGVDRGARGPASGGRGVAIGMTWNARGEVLGNLVRRYWKGIGIFVDAEATVRENIVEDVLTWGITLWDAEKGRPFGDIQWNAVHGTGACGISVTRGLAGGRAGSIVAHNAIVKTGQNPKYDSGEVYCRQQAIAAEAPRPDIWIGENWCFGNREAGGAPGGRDVTEAEFRAGARALLARLGAGPATACSGALRALGADAPQPPR